MKDQEMSSQNLIQHSITKSRFERKNIKGIPESVIYIAASTFKNYYK